MNELTAFIEDVLIIVLGCLFRRLLQQIGQLLPRTVSYRLYVVEHARTEPFFSGSKNIGILLLCEVAVKPYVELNNADYHADQTSKAQNKM